LPPLMLLYTARFADLLFFLAACAVSFRLAPEYSRTFAALALLPMMLHQAAGVTADVPALALGLVAIACLLWLRTHRPERRALLAISAVFVAWALCKLSPWAFGALLLTPRSAFPSRAAWLKYIAGTGVAMAISIGLWQAASRANVEQMRL